MIRNYLKTAWRNLLKNKGFSFINVFGLSVGLACCMLISMYLYQELHYDDYAKEADNIYRVELHVSDNSTVADYPSVDDGVGPGIKRTYPEVLAFTRLIDWGDLFVKYQENQFKEHNIALVDSNFMSMFSIPLTQGDTHTALTDPHCVVISQAMAVKYFGGINPVGRMLTFGGILGLCKVTGVFDKIPENSHFHFDILVSHATLPAHTETWSNLGNTTYLLLDKHADVKRLEAKFPQLVAKYIVPEVQHDMGISLAEASKSVNTFKFALDPLKRIHLYSQTKFELEPGGDIHYIYIFGALAFFILLLACINFTNLSTAASTTRSREVGIRKVMGSLKSWLVSQFLTESIMLTLFATFIALILVYLFLPYFNHLAGRNLTFADFLNYKSVITGVLAVFAVGTLAGIYPAFVLSSFRIIEVLKGGAGKLSSHNFLRSTLVVFQFSVSTILIVATLVVYKQLNFMQNKKLGYDKEHVIVLNDTYLLGQQEKAFEQSLLSDNRVDKASISQHNPTNGRSSGTQIYAKDLSEQGARNEIHTNIYFVDEQFIPTLGIDMLSGRNFISGSKGDSTSVIINQAEVQQLGWNHTDPIGKYIVRSGNHEFKVIGVVKDFNYSSAKQAIAPLMMILGNNRGGIIVKTKPNVDVKQLLADIKQRWASYSPQGPFSYTFMDESYRKLYDAEQRTGGIFISFATIAVIIANLGLFGLAAFVVRQRVKEIGIRKVLGASSATISNMLSVQFVKLVVIAILVAFPIAWFAMSKWLQEFAYRIHISWDVFLLAGGSALLIAFITVSTQSIRASLANPVKSLRSE